MSIEEAAKNLVIVLSQMGQSPGEFVVIGALRMHAEKAGLTPEQVGLGFDHAINQGWIKSHDQQAGVFLTEQGLIAIRDA